MVATPNGTVWASDGLRLAGFGQRFTALLIDWAFCLLVASLYANPFTVGWPPTVVLIVLNTVGIGFFGRTLGMTVLRIRCVSYADGGAIGPWRGLLRAVLLALLVPALIMNAEARGWHDRAAGSIVVAPPSRDTTPGA